MPSKVTNDTPHSEEGAEPFPAERMEVEGEQRTRDRATTENGRNVVFIHREIEKKVEGECASSTSKVDPDGSTECLFKLTIDGPSLSPPETDSPLTSTSPLEGSRRKESPSKENSLFSTSKGKQEKEGEMAMIPAAGEEAETAICTDTASKVKHTESYFHEGNQLVGRSPIIANDQNFLIEEKKDEAEVQQLNESSGEPKILVEMRQLAQARDDGHVIFEKERIGDDDDIASASIARINTPSAEAGKDAPTIVCFLQPVAKKAIPNDDCSSSAVLDASGRCTFDLELQRKPADEIAATQNPAGDRLALTKNAPTKEYSSPNGAPESLSVRIERELKVDTFKVATLNRLPTPFAAIHKEPRDAAIKEATEPPGNDIGKSLSHLSMEILARKDEDVFGLLARGDSLKLKQAQAQEPVPLQWYSNGSVDYAKAQSRLRHDQVAIHQRKPTSVEALSRKDSGRGEEFTDNMNSQSLNEKSNKLLDDDSWRPSLTSYPSSPSGLPAQQPIPMNNLGYMMMPPAQIPQMSHHPGQPSHAFMAAQTMLHHQSSFHSQQSQLMGRTSFTYQQMPAMAPLPSPAAVAPGGKRKMKLKLQEEIARPSHIRRPSFFFGARSTRKLVMSEPLPETECPNEVDRGIISVSWFEGTSSLELQDHVNRSVERRLKLDKGQQLDDIRILDTKVEPPEEIVLCPYIPNGSEFVLRYKVKLASGLASPTFYGPPDSPSAAPSPFPSHGNLGSLDSSQLAVLRKQLDAVQEDEKRKRSNYGRGKVGGQKTHLKPSDIDEKKRNGAPREDKNGPDSDTSDADNESEMPESSVDAKLRQITELLLMDKQKQQQIRYPQVEKRQVIFVLANYFVLFVAFITILAEMQARAPQWLNWMENQLENVQNCSADQDALFKCVSNGEFAGLFATVVLWLSRSATTKQIFLLGFDSPKKLWTVFYESLVGAFCWGVSYMFIRRGMNPDTRPQFLQKYWKDAVYGSLAGFNATFMKAVLKNLIPREAVEEAFNDRQLKILSWLPTFS